MQLFYNRDISENTTQFSFTKEESKHITKVLRKREGDLLHLTNGKGWLFEAKILIADLKPALASRLEGLLDRYGGDSKRLTWLYRRAMQLELAFFQAVWEAA